MRSDDLAPLFDSGGEPGVVRAGQGVVIEWDRVTAENVIRYRGSDLVNLTTLASSTEIQLIKPGDVVTLHFVSGSGGTSTAYIVGRVTRPGTPQAGSFMDLFGFKQAYEAAQGNAPWGYGNLAAPANPGPAVTVTIGRTGRALALIQVEIVSGRGTVGFKGGKVGVALSGANTEAVGDRLGVGWTKYNATADSGAIEAWMGSGARLYSGLNPGPTTFTLQYTRSDLNCDTSMKDRSIGVLPL